ncbi:family 43 glycosylhydrolase [uncultured Bacteroides sp.]|uniref:family 43 glycosylhydrolase n=1 Tax=uncultured Bacteroides sp. TaxID=162156 RepID=UPI002620C664|nr:family 43 glycosylhydrolase [uncultured Bacteroides sp.]
MMKKKYTKMIMNFFFLLCLLFQTTLWGQSATTSQKAITSSEVWKDTEGNVINAHGGGILAYNGRYYWFGEHRPEKGFTTEVGVTCYSSDDLRNWKYEGVALSVSDEAGSDIEKGCIMERPKVIYNRRTGKFVMWFHLELKGQGYGPARAGVAVSDTPAGPYRFVRSGRVNPGIYPLNMTREEQGMTWNMDSYEWWTPEWRDAVGKGMFVKRDVEGGQMSRDMTLFVDTDGKAYHIYSSEENLTLHIAELTDDYMRHSGRYVRLFPGGHNEAPTLFKKDGIYWMITSGCTGWEPNEARMFSASSIWGPWKQHPNPCRGENSEKTFGGQGTFVLPLSENRFLFMADVWKPKSLMYSGYIWLPVLFDGQGVPFMEWSEDMSVVDMVGEPEWKLVWSDEFDKDGRLDAAVWNYETGFVRNEEAQWYQDGNAYCKDGKLIIEARKETGRKNPLYDAESDDWSKSRKSIDYTSSCVTTAGKKEFLYGRFEVRAKIPVGGGAWPAIWTLGSGMEWPSCGEIDIMEYYRIKGVPHILANAAWGTDRQWEAKWNSRTIPFSHFTDKKADWADDFHLWRMDWDETAIRIYLDDELLNEILLSETVNGNIGQGTNPFRKPHYLLLNLALGGINGGEIDDKEIPMRYEIDYVRIYQKK